jgi:hypothetical protein
MDVRFSAEQRALRNAAAQVVDRLGPTPSVSSTTPSVRPSSTPPSPTRAGATCARRTTRGALGVRGRGRRHRRGAGAGPRRRLVPGADAGRRAAPARWCARGHGTRDGRAGSRSVFAGRGRRRRRGYRRRPCRGRAAARTWRRRLQSRKRRRWRDGHGRRPHPADCIALDLVGVGRRRPVAGDQRGNPPTLDRAWPDDHVRRPRRLHAGRDRPHRPLRQTAPAVREADRLVPGPATRARRRRGGHLEGSRTAALYAAWAVDALAPADTLAAAASAKAYSSRAARTVCEIGIQVHGGIGNTWGCLAHVHLRRALLATDVLGGVGLNLARVLEHAGIGSTDGLR